MTLLLRLGALLVLGWLLGLVWFAVTLPGAAALSLTTDAVVVLTGSAGRLARGLDVLQHGSAQRLLVSGVHKNVDKSELSGAAAVPKSLFASKVDLGTTAVDTRSNAGETAAWVARHHYRSLRLVTSQAHMRRALLELRAQLPPDISVVPDAVPIDEGVLSVAREYSKYLLRRAALAAGL